MKKNIISITFGVLTIIISLGVIIYLSQNVIKIHNPGQLNWIPILATFLGFYFAGLITKNLNIKSVGFLFLTLLIFIPIRLFYFPLILYLLIFACWGVILSRKNIKKQTKLIISFFGILVFTIFLFSQPLIIKQEGFGTDTSGNLMYAKEIWNFNEYEPKKTPNESFLNAENQEITLLDFKGKTIYVTFWATWCGPCIREKPMLDKLKKEFKESDKVLFIDISLDKDEERWRAYLEKNKPGGVQLLSKNEGLTRRNFEISGIPKHIIINSKNQYKTLDFFPMVKAYLENEELLNKWIESERLIIEKTE